MFLVAVGEDLAIDGDRGASHDVCDGTLAVVEQGDVNVGVDGAANQVELHKHVAVVLHLEALVAHAALAGPSAQAIDTRITGVEGILDDAVFALHQNEIGILVDVKVAVAHIADLDVVGKEDKVTAAQGIGRLGIGDVVIEFAKAFLALFDFLLGFLNGLGGSNQFQLDILVCIEVGLIGDILRPGTQSKCEYRAKRQ